MGHYHCVNITLTLPWNFVLYRLRLGESWLTIDSPKFVLIFGSSLADAYVESWMVMGVLTCHQHFVMSMFPFAGIHYRILWRTSMSNSVFEHVSLTHWCVPFMPHLPRVPLVSWPTTSAPTLPWAEPSPSCWWWGTWSYCRRTKPGPMRSGSRRTWGPWRVTSGLDELCCDLTDPHCLSSLEWWKQWGITPFSLQEAWMDKLIMLHSQRTKWFHFPDIDRDASLSVLRKFQDSKRWLLVREIAGAYQTANQKQKWLDNAAGTCEFCQKEDSRRHRLLECPIGSEVRESFSAVIDDILEDESLLPDFPVITRHPDLEALQLMQFASPQPVWGQAICTHARNMVDEGITLHWFTDGSCLHPTCRHTRHSAFAVVLDLCKTDDERRAISEQYRGSTLSIPTFQVVCTARCQGEQDILRAEVSAVVSVAENVGHGVIHVDSQVAISNVQLALTSLHPAAFAGCEHVDLLLRLWKIRHGVHIQLVKIKSHQDPGLIDDPLLRYWALGNNHVDAVAQVACSSLNTALVQQLDLVRQDLKVDKKRLEAVYDLHILLQEVRRLATANKESEISTKLHDHRALCAAFSNWTVQPGVFQFQEPDLRLLGSSAFGEEFARRTVEWSRHLIWPDDASGPLGCNTGITWVELALSWMLFNQLFLPVLRKDCLGINRLCFPGGYDGAKQYGLSFLESGTMVQKLLTNTAGLVPQEIMPSGLTHGKCSALYRLGSCRFYQGLDRRPQIPFQAEVVQLLAAVVGTGRKEALSDTPNLAFPAKQDQVARGTWQFRLQTSSLAMKTARKRRKEIINLWLGSASAIVCCFSLWAGAVHSFLQVNSCFQASEFYFSQIRWRCRATVSTAGGSQPKPKGDWSS